MQLMSTAFGPAEMIPTRFTGDGEDVSPPLLWSDLPTDTASLALLCEDPDAPRRAGQDHPYVHWVIFNILPEAGMLPEGVPHDWHVNNHVICEQGLNSFGRPGYNGPAPPPGHGMHRYFFRLFAVSKILKLPVRPLREHLLQALEGNALASVDLIGTYERPAGQQSLRAGA